MRWGFATLALGLAAGAPGLAAGWPLWATFFGWAIGGFGMGLLFNPTTVTAMSHAEEGAEGLVSSQVNLADAVGFSMMGGIGGAMVAISDRTTLSLSGALGLPFALAGSLAGVGITCAGRVAHARPPPPPSPGVARARPGAVPPRGGQEGRDDGDEVITEVNHLNNPTIQDHESSHRAATSWSMGVPAGVEAKATKSANRPTNSITPKERFDMRER